MTGQAPDWGRLYLIGSVKFHGVPRTEEELAYINSEGSFDPRKVKELRAKYMGENMEQLADPKGEAKIAELEEKIATAGIVQAEPEKVAEEIKEQVETSVITTAETEEVDGNTETQAIIQDEITIEELRAEYQSLYEKDVPVAYKNNVQWLANKIAEKK